MPYGEVWRTGANEGTEITVTKDVTVGGQKLPAGNYTIFTVPGPDSWTIHFNSALGLWGTRDYNKANDVLVLTAKATTLSEEVEQFTIDLPKTDSGSDLVLKWIKTEVRVPVKAAT